MLGAALGAAEARLVRLGSPLHGARGCGVAGLPGGLHDLYALST